MVDAMHRIEQRMNEMLARLNMIERVVLAINHRTGQMQDEMRELLLDEERVSGDVTSPPLVIPPIWEPPVDDLHLAFTGVTDKPPAQVLGAKGVEGGKVMAPAALPPDLEKRLAIVADPMFQRYCQSACDHGIDPGEHPVKQAARVILSLCCVSTPYQLAEPEPAERLNALFARFGAWRASLG